MAICCTRYGAGHHPQFASAGCPQLGGAPAMPRGFGASPDLIGITVRLSCGKPGCELDSPCQECRDLLAEAEEAAAKKIAARKGS